MAGFRDWQAVTDPKLLAEALAEQFRLSQNELEKAQAALQPAFALGLEKAMASPSAWTDLASAFAAMLPGDGSVTPGIDRGQAFVETVFGSDALTQAIARQASLFAGIAPDTLQKLMPGLALLSMEAMVRQTMASLARHQPAGLTTGDFGGAAAEMMRRGANAVEALSRPSGETAARTAAKAANPFADAFGAALKQGSAWMSAAPAARAPSHAAPAQDPAEGTFNPMLPFAAMFDAFAKGIEDAIARSPSQAAPPADAPAADSMPSPQPASTPSAPASNSVDAASRQDGIVADLLRSGEKMQADYAREMASLFERYGDSSKAN